MLWPSRDPKWSRFHAIPIKMPITFFLKIERNIVKFVWNQKTSQAEQSWAKKAKLEASCHLTAKYPTKLHQRKTKCVNWHRNMHIGQWSKIHTWSQSISNKSAKNTPWRKSPWHWDSWAFTHRRMKLDPYSHYTQKSTQKQQSRGWNCKTQKKAQRKTPPTLVWAVMFFSDMTSKTQATITKTKTDKWDAPN